MKTLAEFKRLLGVEVINFNKSAKTQREFATIGTTNIIIASNFDETKPAFVIFNKEKGVEVVCNSGVLPGRAL